MNRETKLRLLMLLGVVGISWSAPLVKLALGLGAHPVTIALWRLLFSTLLIMPFVVAGGKNRKILLTLPLKTTFLLWTGGVLLAFHFLFWFISLSLTTAFVSTVVLSVSPLFMLLGAYLIWHEIPARQSLFGILVAMAGTLVLSFSSSGLNHELYGFLYSLISALCLTGYLLCNKTLRHQLPLCVHTFAIYGTCTITLFLLSLILRIPLYTTGAAFFILCLLLALVSTLCGHSVINYLLKYRSAGTVAALQLGEPIGATVIAYFLFFETPPRMALLGGGLILFGILLFTLRKNKPLP